MMEKRQLGTTDMQITPIGLGAWAIGGDWQYGWGPQDDQESIDTIRRALDLGINWIDTAPAYGLGRSEEVVARALQGLSEKPYVFTKCSLVWDNDGKVEGNLKADSIRQEVEDSLRRLQVDVIDLYQVHWPDPDPDIEEGWQTLADLQNEGKLRAIGVSNFNVQQMERAGAIAPVQTLQPPYSLVRRQIEADILPYCQQNNIGVIVYSPMASGLLTGKMSRERIENLPDGDWRKNAKHFQDPYLSRSLAIADLLGEIGKRHGRTTPEVAVAWTLNHEAVTAAIVGARRPDQVEGFIGAMEFRLSDDEIAEIEAFLRENPL